MLITDEKALRKNLCRMEEKQSPLPELVLGKDSDPSFLAATYLSFFLLQVQSTLLEKPETGIRHGRLAPTCSIYLAQFEKTLRSPIEYIKDNTGNSFRVILTHRY